MGKITYVDKDKNQPTTDPRRKFFDADANEVKASVNALYDSLEARVVNVSASPIILDFLEALAGNFYGSVVIDGARTWQFTNAVNATKLRVIFQLDGAHPQTFPSNVKMASVFWNSTTKIWTPIESGIYELDGTYDGTNWYIKITEPFT